MLSQYASKLWLAIFAVWFVFLSGLPASFMDARWGSPGFIQAIRLNHLYQAKLTRLNQLEQQVAKLDWEAERLQKSRVVQEREIRRVLGYAADDELIFDFTPPTKAQTVMDRVPGLALNRQPVLQAKPRVIR